MKGKHIRNALIITSSTVVLIGLSNGLLNGLSTGMSALPEFRLHAVLSIIITIGLSKGLGAGLVVGESYWLLAGLFQGVSSDTFHEQQRTAPNQGIRRSARNGLLLGLLSGGLGILVGVSGLGLSNLLSNWLDSTLFVLLSSALGSESALTLSAGLNSGLVIGLTGGLLAAILSGGLAWWRHWVLRFLLWREGSIPWRYVPMLDEATQCILLSKEGGGYRFIHDLFRDI